MLDPGDAVHAKGYIGSIGELGAKKIRVDFQSPRAPTGSSMTRLAATGSARAFAEVEFSRGPASPG